MWVWFSFFFLRQWSWSRLRFHPCPFVGRLVWLLARLHKNYWTNCDEIFHLVVSRHNLDERLRLGWQKVKGEGHWQVKKHLFLGRNSRKNWDREVQMVSFIADGVGEQMINFWAFYAKGHGHLKGQIFPEGIVTWPFTSHSFTCCGHAGVNRKWRVACYFCRKHYGQRTAAVKSRNRDCSAWTDDMWSCSWK